MIKKLLALILCFAFMSTAHADKIAIIGGGASGLVSAWLLEGKHDITLYEAKDRLGGHADSVELNIDGKPLVIDAAAEFFNPVGYPHFLNLLKHFHIPLTSFSLTSTFYTTDGEEVLILPPTHDGIIEWKSFEPYNVARLLQFKTVIDKGRALIKNHDIKSELHTFVDTLNISNHFKNTTLYPFAAAQWGVTTDEIKSYSAYNSMKYMVQGYDSAGKKWLIAKNGLQEYIEAVKNSLQTTHVKLNAAVELISRNNGRYVVQAKDGSVAEYDHIIFATEAFVAAKLLANMPETTELSQILSRIKYYKTTIAIHSDPRFMPPKKEDWRVVNIRHDGRNASTSIYVHPETKTPVFKTWIAQDVRAPNDKGGPMPDKLYALRTYMHPATTPEYYAVQQDIKLYNGKPGMNIWFVGMWTHDNDSHESAIVSAMRTAEQLAPNSERLNVLKGKK